MDLERGRLPVQFWLHLNDIVSRFAFLFFGYLFSVTFSCLMDDVVSGLVMGMRFSPFLFLFYFGTNERVIRVMMRSKP